MTQSLACVRSNGNPNPPPFTRDDFDEKLPLDIKSQPDASGPISKLPPETLVQIFRSLVEECHGDTETWYHITHVCQFWRRLAINTSALWTRTPTDSDEYNPNWTRIVLQLSKDLPLDVDLVFTDWKMNLAALQHIWHIRDLYIELFAEDLCGVAYILSFVDGDATMLEYLFIWASECDTPQFKISPTCLPGATRLDHLNLRWADIDWSTPLLRQNLTHLSLQDLSLSNAPSWDEILTALECMPGLSHLTLAQALPRTKARSAMPIIDLPNLQHHLSHAIRPFKRGHFSRGLLSTLCRSWTLAETLIT